MINFNDCYLLTGYGKLLFNCEHDSEENIAFELQLLTSVIKKKHPNIVKYYQFGTG